MDQPPDVASTLNCCHATPRVFSCLTHVMSRSNLQNMKAQKPGLTEWVSFEGNKQIDEMLLNEFYV